jgi:hypothetical protein
MLRKKWVVAAACAVSLITAGAPAHAAGSGSWRMMARLPGAVGDLAPGSGGIIAVGTGSAWAFGSSSSEGVKTPAWELSGGIWRQTWLPGTPLSVPVACGSSAANVWAFETPENGRGTQAVHWNGAAWSLAGAFPGIVDDAIAFGRDNSWAFGAEGEIWRYNGSSWSRMPAPGALFGGDALSPANIWAGGGTAVAHWNGTSWTSMSVASVLPAAHGSIRYGVYDVYAASADNVYAIAAAGSGELGNVSSYILHWNGRAWSKVAYTDGNTGLLTGDGSGGVWLVAGFGAPPTASAVLHYSDGQLTTSIPESGVYVAGLAQLPGTRDILAATASPADGTTMTILKYTPLPARSLIRCRR